jgi:transcription factor CRZ1
MSEYFYHPVAPPQPAAYDYPQFFDNTNDYAGAKQQQQQQLPVDFDFQPFITSNDVYNPHIHTVEAFDNDLDTSLATWNIDAELQLVPTDNSDLFRRIRTETPTRGGPSTILSESASGYDTGYADSAYDPTYGSAYGSAYNPSEASALSAELDMNLQALGIHGRDEHLYGSSPVSPTPGVSLNPAAYSPASSYHRGSFSDYEPQTHMRAPPSSASDYYPHSPMAMGVKYSSSVVQATVSPANVSSQLPSSHSTPSPVIASQRSLKAETLGKELIKDPKRKYQCPTCPRGKHTLLLT